MLDYSDQGVPGWQAYLLGDSLEEESDEPVSSFTDNAVAATIPSNTKNVGMVHDLAYPLVGVKVAKQVTAVAWVNIEPN